MSEAAPWSQRIVPIVIASALFMDLMDSSALATALPNMARALSVEAVDLKLALTAYLFTVAALVPASAWMVDRFGAKQTFMAAMAVFTLGSVCCSLAVDVPTLVAARILQGVGGAMMTPVGRSIVVLSTPKAALASAIAMFTVPAVVAPLIGPPLAGLMIEHLSWRWIFLINLPVGIGGLIAIWLFVPSIHSRVRRAVDLRGFAILFVFIVSLMVIADTAAMGGKALLSRAPLFLLAAGSGYLYVRHARRTANPVVDVGLLRLQSVSVSLACCAIQRMLISATPFLLSLQLQEGLHFSPLHASYVMLMMAVGGIVSRFLAPPLVARIGFKTTMLVFAAVTSALTLAPAFFTRSTPLPLMMGAVLTLSMARTFFFVPATTLLYDDVEPDEVTHATVLHTVAQQLSLGMGVSAAAILLSLASFGSEEITRNLFFLPFLGMALIGLTSLLPIVRLDPRAGEHSQRRPGARESLREAPRRAN